MAGHKLDRQPKSFANVKISGGHGFGCSCHGWSVIASDLKTAIRMHAEHKAEELAAAETAAG